VKKEFTVHVRGECKQVFIPKGYCTIYLQGRAKTHIETSIVGEDICIEDLSNDLPCQKGDD
jgi:hypothetical protein